MGRGQFGRRSSRRLRGDLGQGKERVPCHLEPTWLLHHLPFPLKARERLERLQDLGELGPGLGWRARVRRQQGTAAIRQPLAQAQGLHGHLLLHLVQKTACIGGDITPFSDEKSASKRGKTRPLSSERPPSHEWNPGLSHPNALILSSPPSCLKGRHGSQAS